MTSSPARRTLAPVSGTVSTVSESPSAVVSSTCTTVSAPAGSGAPVMILAASPGATARTRTAGGDVDDDAELAAARLELGAGDGEAVHGGVGERRHLLGRDERSAAARPRACSSGTSSAPSGRTAASTQSRASWMLITCVSQVESYLLTHLSKLRGLRGPIHFPREDQGG